MSGMGAASLACSLAFGWLVTSPLWLLVAVAMLYTLTGIGDSSVYSTALTEVVPLRILGTAYAIRSVCGFGVGAVSPWIFGVGLDVTPAAQMSETASSRLPPPSLTPHPFPRPLIPFLLRHM